jgi:subtilase family serine protease
LEEFMFGLFKRPTLQTRHLHGSESRKRTRPNLEPLESRNLLTVFSPSQIQHAYGVDNVINNYGYDGTGQTIALILAYDNPTAAADLYAFDARFGLPDPNFSVATPQGQPAYNAGWAQEASLDVQWAHAMAPGADILLVEARDNSLSNLLGAVNYARNQPGVSVISMSWGSGEFSGEGSYNSYFTTPSGHNGVTFLAASGDTGGQRIFPSVSPNVVAVGGTSLHTSSIYGDYSSESGWSGSGGGPSSQMPEPDYQWNDQFSGQRTTPDVSMVADPNTGVYVVFRSRLYQIGGTSASSPQWAGIIALADEGLNWLGYDSLDGPGQTLPALYGIADSDIANYGTYDWYDFHDITAGHAGSYTAGPGYDYVTGLGSPVADGLVPDLVNWFTCCGPSGHPSPGSRPTSAAVHQVTPLNAANTVPVSLSQLITLENTTNLIQPSSPNQPALLNSSPSMPTAQNAGLRLDEDPQALVAATDHDQKGFLTRTLDARGPETLDPEFTKDWALEDLSST